MDSHNERALDTTADMLEQQLDMRITYSNYDVLFVWNMFGNAYNVCSTWDRIQNFHSIESLGFVVSENTVQILQLAMPCLYLGYERQTW